MRIWRDIAQAKSILAAGGVVGMPTETVYGLAGAIDRPEAVRAIFYTKERPFFDPLIVHVSSSEEVFEVAQTFPEAARVLCRRFWPGPLTIVLPRRADLDPTITAELDTVAVRMPAHPLALRLIRTVGSPLAAPSANRFGRTSPTTAQHVHEEFEGKVFVLDGGPCRVGLESTVIEVTDDGDDGEISISILRPGIVTEDLLREALAGKGLSVSRLVSAKSPGHLDRHYQPEIPLVVAGPEHFPLDEPGADRIAQTLNLAGARFRELQLEPDAVIAARSLYRKLRDLSRVKCDFIVIKKDPTKGGGAWDAVWDRVARAASLKL